MPDRRDFLKATLAGVGAGAGVAAGLAHGAQPPASALTQAPPTGEGPWPFPQAPKFAELPPSKPPAKVPYKRVATEEAWTSVDVLNEYKKLVDSKSFEDAAFEEQWGSYFDSNSRLIRRLTNLDEGRLADMDAAGIDIQLLSLTSPGVQVFDAATAHSLAVLTNDQIAEAVRRHPTRFRALAAVAPQNPQAAAREIERAKAKLGLNGVIINSHTRGEYLDDQKFWDIFAAAEAHDMAIYLHPQPPSPTMQKPYLDRGLERAIMGFAHEVSMHALAIITRGVFDRFPKLKLVIGHGGEGLPYMMYRIDYMYQNARFKFPKTRLKPSDYMRRNVYITTSGLPYAPAILYAQRELGMDRVLFAMDYPYQYHVEEVIWSDELPLSAAEKKQFFQTNAERVFNL